MTKPTRVVSTKILNDDEMVRMAAAGFAVEHYPFISVEERDATLWLKVANRSEAAVFTSRNAVDIILKANIDLTKKNIFSIGGATKRTLERAGYTVTGWAADAGTLADVVLKKKCTAVDFYCGVQHMEVLPNRLAGKVAVNEVAIYTTALTPVVLHEQPNAIMFFSPSAIESFFQVNTLSPEVVCVCIGRTTGSELAKRVNNIILIAKQHTQSAMVDQVFKHFLNDKAHA